MTMPNLMYQLPLIQTLSKHLVAKLTTTKPLKTRLKMGALSLMNPIHYEQVVNNGIEKINLRTSSAMFLGLRSHPQLIQKLGLRVPKNSKIGIRTWWTPTLNTPKDLRQTLRICTPPREHSTRHSPSLSMPIETCFTSAHSQAKRNSSCGKAHQPATRNNARAIDFTS